MKIPSMFDAIARRYDLANAIISLGMHKSWKRKAVREGIGRLGRDEFDMLDIACGTGDLLEIAKELAGGGKKIGLDPSFNMLKECLKKKNGHPLVRGKAESLPFGNETFDLITVSFGVRNFENRAEAFGEIRRVLKPKGIFVILEFAKPEGKGPIQHLSWFYTKRIVPHVGGLISGKREPYEYLAKSIERFPLPSDLTSEVERVGFKTEKVERLFPPITVLYIFRKP